LWIDRKGPAHASGAFLRAAAMGQEGVCAVLRPDVSSSVRRRAGRMRVQLRWRNLRCGL
jgi:hypothetical protein